MKICLVETCNYHVFGKGYCKNHQYLRTDKKPKPIPKMSPKKKEHMKESGNYYRRAIAENIIKNKGRVCCDNCDKEIKNASGKNVSHIISSASNSTLYHHPLNHFILGHALKDECNCEQQFSDQGKRHTMKIYQEFLTRHEQLNREYYARND